MKIHRFIVDFSDNKITDKEVVSQIYKVLKLKRGEQIILTDGKMNDKLVEIIDVNRNSVEIKILSDYKNEAESEKEIILYCSILKKENFEWVVQKATEVGVKEIIPIISERTIKLDFKQERLEKIIKEAAEQSGRGIIPELHKLKTLDQAIEDAENNDANLLFDGEGEPVNSVGDNKRIGIFIGPEGGWDKKELDLVKEKGFKVVSLGKLTLRAETAVVIASYIALS